MREMCTVFAIFVFMLGLLLLAVGAFFGTSVNLPNSSFPANPAATGAACGFAVAGGLCFVAAALALRGNDQDRLPPKV